MLAYVPSIPASLLPYDLSASHDLLQALLDISLPGVILFRPVFSPDDPAILTDLAYGHLNPAAQQMLRLVENAGGAITVHSQSGVGTPFRVVLPA